MILEHSHLFLKKYKKLPYPIQVKVDERILLFLGNRSHPLLNFHRLKGKLQQTSSMNVTGDYRIWLVEHYRDGQHIITFTNVGTHSELYG